MPKLKTHKGTAKRVKVTGSGKLVCRKSGKRHLLTSKSRSKKNKMGSDALVPKSHEKSLRKLLVI